MSQNGQWPNPQLGICQKCHPLCLSCFGPMSDNCLSCEINKLFYGYTCVSECPDTYYRDGVLNECLPCAANCLTCLSTPTHCTSCQSQLVLNDRHICIDKNLNYRNGCNKSCATCATSGNENQCDTCHKDDKLWNGTCISGQCPDVHFERITNTGIVCDSCHKSCNACVGPLHTDCTHCYPNSTLTSDGLCVSICTYGQYYDNKVDACMSCHETCSQCWGPGVDECHECKSGFHIENYRCLRCCPTSPCDGSLLDRQPIEYIQITNSIGMSVVDKNGCNKSCATCATSGNENQCDTCHKDDKLWNGTCISGQCPDVHFERITNTGIVCDSCHKSCNACVGPLHTDCTHCYPNSTLTSDGLCVSICTYGQYYDNKVDACMSCHETCSQCWGPGVDECHECKSGFHDFQRNMTIAVIVYHQKVRAMDHYLID
ncbi:unnamed protein product, partial [Oppiella nova]